MQQGRSICMWFAPAGYMTVARHVFAVTPCCGGLCVVGSCGRALVLVHAAAGLSVCNTCCCRMASNEPCAGSQAAAATAAACCALQDIVAGWPNEMFEQYAAYVYNVFQDQTRAPLWFEPFLHSAQRRWKRCGATH
jgi:hypothetical protein